MKRTEHRHYIIDPSSARFGISFNVQETSNSNSIVTEDVVVDMIVVELDSVKELMQKDWSELEKELAKVLESKGIKKKELMAKVWIEEAKANAEEMVKRYIGKNMPKLVEEIAKFVVAFSIVERRSKLSQQKRLGQQPQGLPWILHSENTSLESREG